MKWLNSPLNPYTSYLRAKNTIEYARSLYNNIRKADINIQDGSSYVFIFKIIITISKTFIHSN